VDVAGQAHLIGFFQANTTFGGTALTAFGSRDIFVVKLAGYGIATPPTITTQPTNQTVFVGTNVVLNVGATGSGPLRYQWRFNGGDVPQATNDYLLLFNVQLTNSGSYLLTVTNASGAATSAIASLTVTLPPPPTITNAPQSQSVFSGDDVSFLVGATGWPPLTYQWRRNGTNLPGATNTLLILTNVQANAAGNYDATVANPGGAVTSAPAALTITATACESPPAGLLAWWPGDAQANDLVGGAQGVAIGGLSNAPGYVGQAFAFNGVNAGLRIPARSNLDVGAGNGFTLEAWINPSDISDERPLVEWIDPLTGLGVFWDLSFSGFGGCTGCLYADIRDTAGGSHALVSGSVLTPNVFQHIALSYHQGSGVARLYHNGVIVAEQTFGSFTPKTGSEFYIGSQIWSGGNRYFQGLIDEVAIYDRALTPAKIQSIYDARHSGKCQPSPDPPGILIPPANQTTYVGDTAVLNVLAAGATPFSYQWTFNGTNLPGATNIPLTLPDVQTNSAGTYRVSVANASGAVTSAPVTLTVLIPTCVSPPAGLVAWWPGDTPANDLVGGAQGVILGGLTNAPGRVGQAFVFNGVNAGIRIPARTNLNVGAGTGMTVEAWINPASLSSEMALIEWSDPNGP